MPIRKFWRKNKVLEDDGIATSFPHRGRILFLRQAYFKASRPALKPTQPATHGH
jgi:hypothetical protein